MEHVPSKQLVGRPLFLLTFKCLAIVLPLILLIFIEAAFLPSNTFTFRCWEALSVRSLKWAFPGPFYPNQNISRVEVGDLASGTKYEVPRPVTWVTDEYGFRNHPHSSKDISVVIVGDSYIAGSGLSQEEILPEVIEHEYGVNCYGYAPSNMKHFLTDSRFSKELPNVVILAMVERSFSRTPPVPTSDSSLRQSAAELGRQHPGIVSFLDRALAPYAIRYLQRRTNPQPRYIVQGQIRQDLLFLETSKPESAVRSELRQHYRQRIRDYHQTITNRGAQFVFMPIPDKELIYADHLPSKEWPTMIPKLVEELRADGIAVVDLREDFLRHRDEMKSDLYQLDDTHWAAPAVKIAARRIHEELTRIASPPQLTDVSATERR